MASSSSHLPLVFSSLGHCYMHLFTAFYFVIVLALEETWALPYHELIELWTLGSLMVGLAALPARTPGRGAPGRDRPGAPGLGPGVPGRGPPQVRPLFQ